MREKIERFFDEWPFVVLAFIGRIMDFFTRIHLRMSGWEIEKNHDGSWTMTPPE